MKDFKLNEAREDVENLLRYVSWLESKRQVSVSHIYNENGLSKNSFAFPVYDSTLLSFIREAEATKMIDSNYQYLYSEHFVRGIDDERKIIEESGIKEAGNICAIFSKYVLKGMTKGLVWEEGVFNGIFLDCILKWKKLLEIWDAPLAQ